MPWTETEPMKQRTRFVVEVERGLYSMSELCERYGISRRTGYKWLDRYEANGPAGLQERSRAPHHCPHRIDAGMAAAIVEARRQHPSWGPFCSTGLHGLSALNGWWMRLGIRPVRIEPSHPGSRRRAGGGRRSARIRARCPHSNIPVIISFGWSAPRGRLDSEGAKCS